MSIRNIDPPSKFELSTFLGNVASGIPNLPTRDNSNNTLSRGVVGVGRMITLVCLLSEQVLLSKLGGIFKIFLKRAGSIKRASWNFLADSKNEQAMQAGKKK